LREVEDRSSRAGGNGGRPAAAVVTLREREKEREKPKRKKPAQVLSTN
jgi:hypothetical protein